MEKNSLLGVTLKIVYHPTEGVSYRADPEAIFAGRISRLCEKKRERGRSRKYHKKDSNVISTEVETEPCLCKH